MKVLVLNCGSSSIKYKLFDMDHKEVIAQGGIEKIGLKGSFLKLTLPDGGKKILEKDIPEHTVGVEFILNTLISPEYGAIKSLDEINAVGHRMVHGGEKFAASTIITDEVMKAIEECNDLAPLHNPANLIGINACKKLMPTTPMVAVFDTAFHQTMPEEAYMYGLPYEYYEKYKIRRYGFHGTSHKYVAKVGAELAGLDFHNSRIITCHIGNGSSITAIKNGKVIDTSMGLTPLDGFMMGTRTGTLDPSVVTFIAEKENLTPAQLSDLFNKKSGLLGISGISSDDRDICKAEDEGDERAHLAHEMLVYQIQKFIGSYVAALNGVDAIVFTAGLGENQDTLRERICTNMEYLGIKFDHEANKGVRGKEKKISAPDSKVAVYIVPTNEELVIARDTKAIVEKL